MTKPLKRSAADMIAAATAPKPVAAAIEDTPAKRNATKANTKQITLYLPNPVYRQIREIAFYEDTKMHPLILEGLDMLFKSRNRPEIAREGHGKG